MLKEDPAVVRDFYDRNGYYIFRDRLPLDAIRAVHACLEQDIYPSSDSFLRHPSITKQPHEYRTFVEGGKFVSNALFNPHLQSKTTHLGQLILKLVCSDETALCLEALDGELAHTMHQGILFFVPPGTEPHIDGWALDTLPPGNFMTLWVPLESITLRNGPVAVFPWKRGKFMTPEMLGVDLRDDDHQSAYFNYTGALAHSIHDRRITCVVPQLEPGDFIVFSSLTPHATMPPENQRKRRMALQILARPTASRWGGSLMSRLKGEAMEGDPPATISVGKHWHAISSS
jgi:ectoine hydroxylase-related dioxygenase (phytanoyl-CoA dioxygenase family)